MERIAVPRNPHEVRLKRMYEILPGALTWTALLFPIIASPYIPAVVAIIVLIFDFYWFMRSFYFSVNIVRAYFQIRHDEHTDWGKKLDCLKENPKIYQAIVIVFYKEPLELLRESIKTYAESTYDNKHKTILVMGGEERAGGYANDTFTQLKREFGNMFFKFELALHPANIPGEIKCKSANATWAAKRLKDILDDLNISYRQTIIHNFDADTRVHKQYFNCVAYKYLASPKDSHTSFQPIHFYTNNIWETPAITRIVATSSTFTFMYNTLRPHRFKNFSSRSDIFQTVMDIGFYVCNAIPEDSRQFIDMFFKYKGNATVTPIFIPLRMDAVLAEGYIKTLQNQYRQLRRWAWGASDLAEFALRASRDKQIPFWDKFWEGFRMLESHFTWSTAAIYITIVGWLPLRFGKGFSTSVFGYNLPRLTQTMLTLAASGLILTVVLSILLYQPRPKHKPRLMYAMFFIQWILTPIVSIFFSCFAAIDAQTRLMLRKYLEYQITEKKAVTSQ